MEDTRFTQLIILKLNNEATLAEEQELKALIESDEWYAQRYQSFMEYWNNKETDNANSHRLFQKLSSRIAELENEADDSIEETAVTHLRTSKRAYLFRAAAVTVFILAGVLFYHKKTNRPGVSTGTSQNISTSLSAIKNITLEDGSTVKLNGNSSLSEIKMFPDHREITLNGEGFFNITKDPNRPFTIHTSKMDVRVLGTSFNVRAYPGEKLQEAVLIHGAIRVTLHNKQRSVILLKPDDKLTINANLPTEKPGQPEKVNYTLSKLEHYDNDSAPAVIETAWTNNHLVFRNETFEVLAHRLEIRYGVKIIFRDDALKELRFNGTFKKENLQDVLYVLSRTGNPFTYKIDGREVYIN